MNTLSLTNDYNIIIFVLILSLALLSLFSLKTIVSLVVIIVLLLVYNNYILRVKDTQPSIEKGKQDISKDINYNQDIQEILLELKYFKKYNKVSYKDGLKYLRKFFKTISILENDNIMNPNQYLDNARLYLKTSINYLQSITISLPERGMIKAIKYGDFEPTKKVNKLGNLCRRLYNECHNILVNISIKYNDKWRENPNIYTKEIDINTKRKYFWHGK